MSMDYHHLYADDAGESHWREVEVRLMERTFAPPATGINVSEPESVARMMFMSLRAGWNEPVHPTPKKQALICLAGVVRVTASDGESRKIGPGEVWLMEDLIGKGHRTHVISDREFKALIIQYN
jgi:quercetin dioxygenase-like cupin family protein